MNKLFEFDVTLKDLDGLRNVKFDKTITVLDFLKKFWFESADFNPDYWDKVRVGTIDVYLDDYKQLHLDFRTRFHLGNYPEIIEAFNKLKE